MRCRGSSRGLGAKYCGGKTTCKVESQSVKVEDIVEITKEMIAMHKNVTLGIDIFFVNKIPFFVTLSHDTLVTHLSDRRLLSIFVAVRGMYNYYLKRGFCATMVMANGEFAPLQTLLSELHESLMLNLRTAANEHKPFVECRICVIKGQTRVVHHLLPFKTLPRKITANIVLNVTYVLNFFLTKGGLSMTLSPKTIMIGETINYKYYTLPFGSYCQVHEEAAPHNSLAACTQGTISLGPSGNMQGAQCFLSRKTGDVITQYAWDAIPMPTGAMEWG